MNHLLAVLAFVSSVQQTPPTPAEAASRAAVEAFTEACVQGELRLTPERGRILKKDELTDFTGVLPPGWPQKRVVTVKLNYPPQTYLVFADFDHLQPHSIASECILASGAISKRDAMGALMSTAPGIDPLVTYIPVMYLPEWTIDQPRKGFRSRMQIRDDGSIVLEVGVYNSAPQQSGSKQQ